MERHKNFISFEGIDFSGKSTQIQLLLEKLNQYGIAPILLREPGGTVISEKIRDILLSPVHREMTEKTEILLYSAARAQLVHQEMIPLLKQGKYIIADRFYDSTTAYQGYGRGLDLEVVRTLNRFATSGLTPYRTFYIDILPEEAAKRKSSRGGEQDRLESGGLDFFERIREGFLNLCNKEPQRFIRIDGNRNRMEIAEIIWQEIMKIWSIRLEDFRTNK
ncbi:MAG: dTMP kinase [Calditrichia bacterium]